MSDLAPPNPSDPVFFRLPRPELERRWREAREHMKAKNLDAVVIQGWDDPLSGYLRWFCDFGSISYMKVALFFADAPMVVIEHGGLDGRRAVDPDAPDTPGVDTVITTSAFASIAATHLYEAEAAAQELKRHGCRNVGLLRPSGMSHGLVRHLHDALPNARFSDETDALDLMKAIKSPEEQAHIRDACRVQDQVFDKVLATIRPGLRDIDLVSLAEREFRLLGAEDGTMAGGSAPPGKPAMLRMWRSQNRVLETGDCFTLLLEMSHASGYYGEMARQIVLGPATAEHRDAYEVLREAQAATVAQFKPGASCAEIAASHDALMAQYGRGPEVRIYSHGQGYDLVERPMMRRDETMRLQAGMFLSCHPAIGSPTLFAFLCDNFLVSADGPAERLHATAQDIFEL